MKNILMSIPKFIREDVINFRSYVNFFNRRDFNNNVKNLQNFYQTYRNENSEIIKLLLVSIIAQEISINELKEDLRLLREQTKQGLLVLAEKE